MNEKSNSNPDENLQAFLSRRRAIGVGLSTLAGGAALGAASLPARAADSAMKTSRYQISLGDFAKGDGSDETAAIQRAIDSVPSAYAEHHGAELLIPRPPKFYGISKTINIEEKWNCIIRCATPAIIERVTDVGHNHYFHWLGADGATMFRVNSCKGLHLVNLSLNGRDKTFTREDKSYVGSTSGVVGITFSPPGRQAGFNTDIVVDTLTMTNVHDGVLLGEYADNGPDVRTILFNHLGVFQFAGRGLVMQSGNLATITLLNPSFYTHPLPQGAVKAKACIEGRGGEVLVLNHNSGGFAEADIALYSGGIQVVKAWSEIFGPFLKTGTNPADLRADAPYHGAISYPVILEGCRHFNAQYWNPQHKINTSIEYDLPVPLNMIGCTMFRDVVLGEKSGGSILEQGTLFIDGKAGFGGPGITRHRRIVSLGSRRPSSGRIIEPYFVDKRNTPGTASPKSGVWQRGDGIINIEPDPKVETKACRGWVCIETGEPGRWVPYGALVA